MRTGRNQEGYSDPTASAAMSEVIRKEHHEVDERAKHLIKELKSAIHSQGFELIDRIKIKDCKSGREYK